MPGRNTNNGEGLKDPIHLAEAVRFKDDIATSSGFFFSGRNEPLQRFFLNECLPIDATTTPKLSALVRQTCKNINFPSEAIHSFVFASPVVQAECISAGNNECFIRISSQLIALLTPTEMQFVIGHEIGHFLLGHSHQPKKNQDLRTFAAQRAAEISADRLGLIACKSIESSITAILKTLSGLDATHLNLDVSGYLDHVRKLKNIPADLSYAYLSHPPLPLRARAILWFSMSEEYHEILSDDKSGGLPKKIADERVATDLKNFVEKEVYNRQDQLLSDLQMWLFCAAAVRDGVLEKEEQSILLEKIGEADFKKLLKLFKDKTASEARGFVCHKVREVYSTLRANELNDTSHEIEKIFEEIKRHFQIHDFEAFLKDHGFK